MPPLILSINGANRRLTVDPDTPLLWVLRDTLNLTGTKFGCGRGLCGSCTVLMDGEPTRSCVTPGGGAVHFGPAVAREHQGRHGSFRRRGGNVLGACPSTSKGETSAPLFTADPEFTRGILH